MTVTCPSHIIERQERRIPSRDVMTDVNVISTPRKLVHGDPDQVANLLLFRFHVGVQHTEVKLRFGRQLLEAHLAFAELVVDGGRGVKKLLEYGSVEGV